MLFPSIQQIGDPLQVFQMNIRRRSKQNLIIDWFEDEALQVPGVEVDGLQISIVIGERESPTAEWPAISASNTTTWNITEAMSDLPFSRYHGAIVLRGSDMAESILLKLDVRVDTVWD
jgi:hypothetical protein